MNLDDIEILFSEYIIANEKIIRNSRDNLKLICERHSINHDKSENKYEIAYLLEEKIKDILDAIQGELEIEKLRELKSHLLLKQYGLNLDFNHYIQYLECIATYRTSTEFPCITNGIWWRKLLLIIMDYLNVSNRNFILEYPGMNMKERNEGEAIKYWVDRGYRIRIKNGKVKIEDEDYARMGRCIDRCIEKIGGKHLIEVLLKLNPLDKENLRYNLYRQKNNLELKISSGIPFGYLLNLSVKHYHRKLDKEVKIEKINDLIEMVRHYIALLQLQTYSNMRDFFITNENILEHIYNNVLYDSIFLYKQYNPIFLSRMVKGILPSYYKAINYKKVFGNLKFDDILTLINYILNHPSQQQSFRSFTIDGLHEVFSKIQTEDIRKFLDLFSHQDTPNKDFVYPNNNLSDYDKFPLLKINHEYVLIDRTLNAFSFFDCFCDILRKEYGNRFDDDLGVSLEEFIKELLEKSNIEFSSGYYKENEECDIVIETNKFIFFLEIKKKPLTKKSLTGDGVKLFSDISKSILVSQSQLGKHELNLIKDKKIDLYSKRGKIKKGTIPIKSIEYKNKTIERISVNLNEFGILSDKMMIQKILGFLTGAELKALDNSRDDELDEIRIKAKHLLKQYDEHKLLENDIDLRKKYFNSSFMSLQMLMYRLQNVSNNDEFENDYLAGKYTTSGTGDCYTEYFLIKNLKP